MNLYDLQKQVDAWASQYDPRYWPAFEQLARLVEETGELAREINHLHGTKKKKPGEAQRNLGQELVDVIFTAMCIANNPENGGINLQEEWDKMVREKLYERDKDRFTKPGNSS